MLVLEICIGDRNASTLSMDKTLAPRTTKMATMVLPRDRVDAAIVVAVLVLVLLLDKQDVQRQRQTGVIVIVIVIVIVLAWLMVGRGRYRR